MKLTHENAGFLKITLLFDPNGQTVHIDTKNMGYIKGGNLSESIGA